MDVAIKEAYNATSPANSTTNSTYISDYREPARPGLKGGDGKIDIVKTSNGDPTKALEIKPASPTGLPAAKTQLKGIEVVKSGQKGVVLYKQTGSVATSGTTRQFVELTNKQFNTLNNNVKLGKMTSSKAIWNETVRQAGGKSQIQKVKISPKAAKAGSKYINGKKITGRVHANYGGAAFSFVMMAAMTRGMQDWSNKISNENPFTLQDADGNYFSLAKKEFRMTMLPIDFDTGQYYIHFMTGDNQGKFFEISKENYEKLERIMNIKGETWIDIQNRKNPHKIKYYQPFYGWREDVVI